MNFLLARTSKRVAYEERPRKLHTLVLFAPLLCRFVLAIAEDHANTIDHYWPMDKVGQEWVSLKIPAAFLQADPFNTASPVAAKKHLIEKRDGPIIDELLLMALWPGLTPDAAAIRDASRSGKDGRLVLALMESGATADYLQKHYNALQIAFNIAVEDSRHNICVPVGAASVPRKREFQCLRREGPDEKTPEYGLTHMGVNFSRHPEIPDNVRQYNLYTDDLYYKRDSSGLVVTFIRCRAVERGLENQAAPDSPSFACVHRFISRSTDALVTLTYQRLYLKSWESMEREWRHVIDTFLPESDISMHRHADADSSSFGRTSDVCQ
jgi:hypothetical protein